MKKILIALLLSLPTVVVASGGSAFPLDHVDVNIKDRASLQRGAKLFVNYCLSCHSAKYMRYNRMGRDLGLTDRQVAENLMFAGEKVGDLMTIHMDPEDAKRWFGKNPPDLTLTARSRGTDWIYTYLKGFYLDDSSHWGWNNTVFPDVGMPHVLYDLQGGQRAVFKSDESAQGGDNKVVDHLELESEGKLTPAEYDRAVRDLTNFMAYLAEPAGLVRTDIGVWVLLFLVVFTAISYLLKREYWRDVH